VGGGRPAQLLDTFCSTPYWVKWSVIHNTHGHEIINIQFPRAACFLALAPAA
jgi:hypothetical protein